MPVQRWPVAAWASGGCGCRCILAGSGRNGRLIRLFLTTLGPPRSVRVLAGRRAVNGVVMDHAVTVRLARVGLCCLGLCRYRLGLCLIRRPCRGRLGLCRYRLGILTFIIINQPHFYDGGLCLCNKAQSLVAFLGVVGVKGDLHGSSPVWVVIF